MLQRKKKLSSFFYTNVIRKGSRTFHSFLAFHAADRYSEQFSGRPSEGLAILLLAFALCSMHVKRSFFLQKLQQSMLCVTLRVCCTYIHWKFLHVSRLPAGVLAFRYCSGNSLCYVHIEQRTLIDTITI